MFLGKILVFTLVAVGAASAQMIDNTQAPNTAKAGINKSLQDEIGAGRGSVTTPNSSRYIWRPRRMEGMDHGR